jgi:cell division protein FtsZ
MTLENGLILGIGGSGCHGIDGLVSKCPANNELIVVDTDWVSLRQTRITRRIELHSTFCTGLGTGGRPGWAQDCVETCADEIRQALPGIDFVLIETGLGGGTGSGAAPGIVRIAGEEGIPVLSVVTLPLELEGRRRNQNAREGLEEIKRRSFATLVLPLDEVLRVTGKNISLSNFFQAADRVIQDCILYLVGGIDQPEIGELSLNCFQVFRDSGANQLPKDVYRKLQDFCN